jgi:hypothetical protein
MNKKGISIRLQDIETIAKYSRKMLDKPKTVNRVVGFKTGIWIMKKHIEMLEKEVIE